MLEFNLRDSSIEKLELVFGKLCDGVEDIISLRLCVGVGESALQSSDCLTHSVVIVRYAVR